MKKIAESDRYNLVSFVSGHYGIWDKQLKIFLVNADSMYFYDEVVDIFKRLVA